ncbi:MAG: hypothetical protein HY721_21795 [Planctomycetes bacterium]|nr:hypothetical protein [Planctomycetota bacterium]
MPPSQARERPAALAIEVAGVEKVLLFGGTSGGALLDTIDLYDPATGAVTPFDLVPNADGEMKVAAPCSGVAFVFDELGTFQAYDPPAKKWLDVLESSVGSTAWVPLAISPYKSIYPSFGLAVAAGRDGKVYMVNHSKAHVYDPATGLWNAPSAPQKPTQDHWDFPLVSLGDRVYAVGGYMTGQKGPVPQAYVEAYGPLPDACSSLKGDGWMQDDVSDLGDEPNSKTGQVLWASTDIWVRNAPDGGTAHQNPEFGNFQKPHIYVKVRNRGLAPVTGEVHLYWSRASTGLAWPNHWVSFQSSGLVAGDVVRDSFGNPLTATVKGLLPGHSETLHVEWGNIPDPTVHGTQHFCLLARFVSAQDPMSFAETSSVWDNVHGNNNIAWKNVTVVDLDSTNKWQGVLVRNIREAEATVDVVFRVPDREREDSLLEHAAADVDLRGGIFDRWIEGGTQGRGLLEVEPGVFRLTEPEAALEGLRMGPGEEHLVLFRFTSLGERYSEEAELRRLDVIQLSSSIEGRRTVEGGETYLVEVLGRAPEPPAPVFHRGDADENRSLQLTDAVRILGNLYLGQGELPCADAADANDDGALDISDAVRILGFIFMGDVSPAPPGPPGFESCGPDPTPDFLDCAEYRACR